MGYIKDIYCNSKRHDYDSVLIALISFFLPFRKEISFVLCLFGLILLIFSKVRRNVLIENLVKNQSVLLLSILFTLYLVGLTYSTNISFGFKDIDTKLPLLLLPLLLLSINQLSLTKAVKFFIYGCISTSFICLINSFIIYLSSHNSTVFFYDDLSIFMHTSYFSMYILMALIFSYFFFQNSLKNKNYKAVFLYAFFIFVFLLMIFLLSSKAGVAIALFLIFILVIHDIFFMKKMVFTTMMITQALLFTLAIPSVTKYVFNRFESANEVSKVKITPTSKTNSTTSRLVIYKSTFQVFQENKFFGVGTGDIKDELFKKYKLNNFQYGIDQKYNSHNQYLQFLATFGIFGIVIILISLIFLFIKKSFSLNFIFFLFLLIFLINISVESMLETRAGVEFFTFFYTILNIKNINYDSFFSTSHR